MPRITDLARVFGVYQILTLATLIFQHSQIACPEQLSAEPDG
jgi:hypothetical protein